MLDNFNGSYKAYTNIFIKSFSLKDYLFSFPKTFSHFASTIGMEGGLLSIYFIFTK